MKKTIASVFNFCGLEISKYMRDKKNKKTKNITLHKTVTGNYYLPTDDYDDVVANAIKDNLVLKKK